jgi:hypothetical protein
MSEERPIQAYYDSYAYNDSRSSTRSSSVSHDYQANDMVYDRGVSTGVGHSDRQFFSSHGRSSQTAGYGYQSGSSTPFTSQNTPMRGRLQGHPNLVLSCFMLRFGYFVRSKFSLACRARYSSRTRQICRPYCLQTIGPFSLLRTKHTCALWMRIGNFERRLLN